MNTTHIKFESDALVCMICFAAFIGYALGVQYAVNATKTQCNKVHKVTQTDLNLSELAEILASNHMIINGGGKHVQRDSNTTVDDVDENCEENHSVVESRIVEEEDKEKDKCEEGMKFDEKINPNEILSENVVSNSGNTNNSEEEYEVVIGNIKKLDTKKQYHYYFGWFDSVF
jgi:hypothetical protein